MCGLNVCVTYLNWVVHCCLVVPTVLHHVLRLLMHKRLAFHDRKRLWWKSRHFVDWSRKILCLRYVVNRRYNNRPVRRDRKRKKKRNGKQWDKLTVNWFELCVCKCVKKHQNGCYIIMPSNCFEIACDSEIQNAKHATVINHYHPFILLSRRGGKSWTFNIQHH